MSGLYVSVFVGLIIFLTAKIRRSEKSPIFGLYRVDGPTWVFKFVFIYIILTFRKVANWIEKLNETACEALYAPSKNDTITSAAGYGRKSRSHPSLMDCPQELSLNTMAIDAMYFNGASASSWNIIVGLARRPKGVVNGFMFIRVPGVGTLSFPRAPDTTLQQNPIESSFTAEGMKIEPIIPMVAFSLKYDGLMRVDKSADEANFPVSSTIEVSLNALWTTSLPYFDFDTDMSPVAVASAMAKQPWSRGYFDSLKKNHQTHYEQFGDIKGVLKINDISHSFEMSAVRDHTYGDKRDWNDLHRYALHYFTLKSGERFCLGVICMPALFSRLVIGYVYTTSGELQAVSSTTFELQEHGEGGSPPTDYAFSMTAGGTVYDVQVLVDSSVQVFMGEKWDARVIESFATFTVNGIPGWGAVEFEYHHTERNG